MRASARADMRSLGAALLAILLAGGALLSCFGCSAQKTSDYRGSIETSDGTVLAESVQRGSSWVRAYSQSQMARQLVGDCNVESGSEGLEDQYAEELLAGTSLHLTLESGVQSACEEALAEKSGSAVVLDPATGAVLAMASHAQGEGNSAPSEEDTLLNRAVHARVPGSTFKTITLSAALRSGISINDEYGAPATLSLRDGNVTNAGAKGYGNISLSDAYAYSANTVFAQLSFSLGVPALQEEARRFGFDEPLAQDIACDESTIENADGMGLLDQAWCGVGQALFRDGDTFGPVVTPLQMAAVAAVFANGGTLYAPYVVAEMRDSGGGVVSTGGPKVLNAGFLSDGAFAGISDSMRGVVGYGTGTDAAVPGVAVAGKTGTAETSSLRDDGWFMGFAVKDGRSIAYCVCLQDSTSAEAAAASASIVAGVFD